MRFAWCPVRALAWVLFSAFNSHQKDFLDKVTAENTQPISYYTYIYTCIYICLYAFPRTVSIPNDLMQLRSEDARSDSKNPTAQCAMQCSYIEPRLRQISRGRMSPQREQAWHAWAAFCSSLSFFKRPRQEPISGHHLGSQSLERQLLFCRQQFFPLPECI